MERRLFGRQIHLPPIAAHISSKFGISLYWRSYIKSKESDGRGVGRGEGLRTSRNIGEATKTCGKRPRDKQKWRILTPDPGKEAEATGKRRKSSY
ncbi:hypothetical protein RRG08_044466 [Elysia crispata]|uniref:Uncharacterized protein n=1 Tax=Elysia crispata TaxID=231223 RepID=A0AAE1DU07_9GAST|nr:hypothetical protein RRG08_044466 [Elysia crispata]